MQNTLVNLQIMDTRGSRVMCLESLESALCFGVHALMFWGARKILSENSFGDI